MNSFNDKVLFEYDCLGSDINAIAKDVPIANLKTEQLDSIFGGIRSRIYLICAEPGAGKTTLALQVADELAEQGQLVIFFSFEMKRHLLITKSLSRISDGEIPANSISNICANNIPNNLKTTIEKYRDSISKNIIFVDEVMSAIDMAIFIGKVIRETGRKPVIFLDYLQITPSATGRTMMEQRSVINETMAGLRKIVNNHGVPVFAISSVNRQTYKKEVATLGSLAESSNLEYSADQVLFLAVKGKGESRDKNMRKLDRPVIIDTLKDRYGSIETVDLVYKTQFATFTK